jgi:ethanolamine kinase
MCPPLYARFKNGLVYGFIKGKVSSVEELAQEKTAEWIANKLGKWHQVKLLEQEGSKQVNKLWETMFKWLDQGTLYVHRYKRVYLYSTSA